MDAMVVAAMAKWPNVPSVFGWLSLTARGEWRIKGQAIENEAIRDFISRNYTNDGCGNWFFQNGPQRVYVTLELTPLIYRLDEFGRLMAHTGAYPHEVRQVFADRDGRIYFETDLGPGALDDRDAMAFSERLSDEAGEQLNDWSTDHREAILDTAGLHVRCERPCHVDRIETSRAPEMLGFLREPQSPRRVVETA